MKPRLQLVPSRGEIWLADFNPTKGREQAGVRPCLIVSVDPFNHGPLDLIVAIPITSTQRDWPTHVELRTVESGLKMKSFVKCEDVRSMSSVRLVKRIGGVSQQKMEAIADRLRIILGL